MPIYAVSHRRGDAAPHKFIATFGTTLKGAPLKAFFEDEEERYCAEVADFEVARKSPCVLNDFTLAQPTIDRHNRYRQHLLAMEKRFNTNTFAFRYFTTLLGMVAVNAFFAHRYFNSSVADFKSEMDKLGFRLMNNHEANSPEPSPPKVTSTASPFRIDLDVCHDVLPLKSLPGYIEATQNQKQKGKQQRCVWCNNVTSACCKGCSTGPCCVVPICPERTIARKGPKSGKIIYHSCMSHHRLNPTYHPHGRHATAPGSGAKRPRTVGSP